MIHSVISYTVNKLYGSCFFVFLSSATCFHGQQSYHGNMFLKGPRGRMTIAAKSATFVKYCIKTIHVYIYIQEESAVCIY